MADKVSSCKENHIVISDEEEEEEDEEEDSFMSCLSSLETESSTEGSYTYIQLIFDPERGGFVDVAENIVQYLDYHSLINFKRSSSTIYNFFKELPFIENQKLEKKLDIDWRLGQPKNYAIQTPGLVSCASVFPDNRKIVIGIDHVVHVVDIRSGKHNYFVYFYYIFNFYHSINGII